MAPFVGQMTKLDENVSLLLIGHDQELEEDGETSSVESVKDSDHERVDMEASPPALLDSNTTDKAAHFLLQVKYCVPSLNVSFKMSQSIA